MKQLFAVLLMIITATAIAQDKTQEQKNAEQLAAYKKSEDAQKALNEKRAIEDKAKADAIEKMDNKNPQPIKKAEDRERIATLFVSVLLAQQEFTVRQQQAINFLASSKQQAEASAKALNDAIKELQKSHHAEACDLTPLKMATPEKPEDRGLDWDCTNAASNAKK